MRFGAAFLARAGFFFVVVFGIVVPPIVAAAAGLRQPDDARSLRGLHDEQQKGTTMDPKDEANFFAEGRRGQPIGEGDPRVDAWEVVACSPFELPKGHAEHPDHESIGPWFPFGIAGATVVYRRPLRRIAGPPEAVAASGAEPTEVALARLALLVDGRKPQPMMRKALRDAAEAVLAKHGADR